ncbi:MAG: hypothetical protein HQK49_05805 [Oligoflexia bacterium]|nr:hypothetical protein [Oligoflexia bacterium]
MKKIFFYFLSIMFSIMFLIMPTTTIYAKTTLPTHWNKILSTDSDCKIKATFWMLSSSPFAYLILANGEMIPMYQEKLAKQILETEPRWETPTLYISVSKGDGLDALPTYELNCPAVWMNRLAVLKVSWSGRQEICFMPWVWPMNSSSENVLIDSKSINAGSIGHGVR